MLMMKHKKEGPTRKSIQQVLLCALTLLLSFDETQSYGIDCGTNEDCALLVGFNSTCKSNGKCSNPFESGCLRTLLPTWNPDRLRMCNSEDPPEAWERGICRKADIDYLEIRLFAQNWETPFFVNWLLQIILSEILDVPTTTESGTPEAKGSFYDADGRFDFGNDHDTISLEKATELGGDCSKASRKPDTYEACAHFLPEEWNIESPWIQELILNGIVEPAQSLGVIGQEGLFVTKFTVEQDPSLTSYFGLQGEENRQRLAAMFKRPTSWGYYCDFISSTRCAQPNEIAERYPENDAEYTRMFVDGLYTGHFRHDDKNDCKKHGTNCTGHVADYPCGWSSPLSSQIYHLDIALESNGDEEGSGGYTYSQLVDMWHAANHTKENLMMHYWLPENLFREFLGTDAEMIRIAMPARTQRCEDNRVQRDERCSDRLEERVGDPAGVCDEGPISLHKLISTGLQAAISRDTDSPDALRNPARDVLSLFRISELQLIEIGDYHTTYATPRAAVCAWAAENIDYLQTFVPQSFPRVVEHVQSTEKHYKALILASVTLGVITTMYVMFIMMIVHKKRKTVAMQRAQLEFLFLVLMGSFFIGIGTTIKGLQASDASCVVTIWFINIGYTLQIVSLIVKIAAINRIMAAGRRCRRVILTKKQLLSAVFCICFLVIPYLLAWTMLDVPRKAATYTLTQSQTLRRETIVEAKYHCQSDSYVWNYAAIGWNALLLFCATIIAYQSRNLRHEFNESRTLGIMIYSHFFFEVFRLIILFLQESVSQFTLEEVQSLLYSVDTVVTVTIYVVPKFFISDEEFLRRRSAISGSSDTFQSTIQAVRPMPVLQKIISNLTLVSHSPKWSDEDQANCCTHAARESCELESIDSSWVDNPDMCNENDAEGRIVAMTNGDAYSTNHDITALLLLNIVCPNCGECEVPITQKLLEKHVNSKVPIDGDNGDDNIVNNAKTNSRNGSVDNNEDDAIEQLNVF